MLLSPPPTEIAAPWDWLNRRRFAERMASFARDLPLRPGGERAAFFVEQSEFVVSGGLAVETADFSAFGFESWSSAGSFSFHSVRPPADLALYKQRTGTGSHVYYDSFSVGNVTVTFGTANWAYELVGGAWRPVRTPDDPDTATPDVGSPYSLLFEPQLGGSSGSFGSDIPWRAYTSTSVSRAPTPPFTGPAWSASIDLSSACTWADVEAAAAQVITSGYGSEPLDSVPPAYNSGDGLSDGTYLMAKRRARYRVPSSPYARRAIWREVTRRNNAGFIRFTSTLDLSLTTTLARRALTEPIALPYFDEWGAWSPAALQWEATGERLLRWAAGHTSSPSLVLYGRPGGLPEAGYDRSVFATRFRLLVDTEEVGLIARVNLGGPSGPEVLDLPITAGTTAVVERVATATPTGSFVGGHFLSIATVSILRDGEPAGIPFNIAFRQRRSLRISGHAALDGSDTYLTPARYRVQTTTIEWGLDATVSRGAGYDAGLLYQMPATGSARLIEVRAYDALTGAQAWAGTGEITERTGAFAGIPWLPTGYGESEFFPATTETATLRERVRPLNPTQQLNMPLDANTPTEFGEVLAVVEWSEDIPAGEAGAWHTLDCTVRGAAVFLEDVAICTLPT